MKAQSAEQTALILTTAVRTAAIVDDVYSY